MEKEKQDFDYEALKKKTREQFRSGKSLFGKDGAFAPLLKDFLEAAWIFRSNRATIPDKLSHPKNLIHFSSNWG